MGQDFERSSAVVVDEKFERRGTMSSSEGWFREAVLTSKILRRAERWSYSTFEAIAEL